MKKILCALLLFIVLAGCSTEEQKLETLSSKFLTALGNDGSGAGIQRVSGQNTDEFKICSEYNKICYEFTIVNKDGNYVIREMQYSNTNISKDVKYVAVYPEKTMDTTIYQSEEEQKLTAQLEQDFQAGLKNYDISWEELDKIAVYQKEKFTKE